METQAPKTLREAGIDTVGQLLAHTRDQIRALTGMGAARMAAVDAVFGARGLVYGRPTIPTGTPPPSCTVCPRCPDCGNPRAQRYPAVAVDLYGRAVHMGHRVGPVCDACDAHHRALAAGTVTR
jgi:hypothetical protein